MRWRRDPGDAELATDRRRLSRRRPPRERSPSASCCVTSTTLPRVSPGSSASRRADHPTTHGRPIHGPCRALQRGRRSALVLVHVLPDAGHELVELDGGSNRAGLEKLAANDPSPGLVAYRDDGRWAGSASARARATSDWRERSCLRPSTTYRSGRSSVSWFRDPARGSGVGTALLRAAIDHATVHGATMLEAYPVAAERGRVPAASAFQGSQSMFEKAGFEVVEVRQWNATSPPRPIMRRSISR